MHALRTFVNRYTLVVFFVLTYALSWSISLWEPHSLNAAGPLMAALMVLAISSGGTGVAGFLRRIVHWRVRWWWYALALLLPVSIVGMTAGLNMLLGADLAPRASGPAWGDMLATAIFVLLYIGLGEEPAWRGFALPRLMEGRSALAASLLLAVLHILWHLPLAGLEYNWQNGAQWVIMLLSGAVVYTWMYQHTNGSLLLPILLHTSVNLSAKYLFFPLFTGGDLIQAWWLMAALWFVVAAVIVWATGPNLVRRDGAQTALPYAGQPLTAK